MKHIERERTKFMRRICWLGFIVLLFAMLASMPPPASADPLDGLTMMSEEFPPYNFTDEGHITGLAAELLQAMLDHIGSSRNASEVQILPWARAYDALLNTPGTMLFSMTRTKDREHLFRWVGPIAPNRNVLIARKDRGIHIDSLSQLSKFRIGAIPQDAGAQLLLDSGVDRSVFDYANNAKLNALKLALNRIDMFAYAETVAYWVIKQSGLPVDEFETVYVIEDGFVYFALHRSTPDEVVSLLQDALDTLRANGVLDRIISKYVPS